MEAMQGQVKTIGVSRVTTNKWLLEERLLTSSSHKQGEHLNEGFTMQYWEIGEFCEIYHLVIFPVQLFPLFSTTKLR